jgi:hypothetical protein
MIELVEKMKLMTGGVYAVYGYVYGIVYNLYTAFWASVYGPYTSAAQEAPQGLESG